MTPPDSNRTPADLLEPETVTSLRDALSHYLAERHDGPRLRDALGELAREARRKDLPAEQMIIAVKSVWHSLPALKRVDALGEQSAMLQRVVTACIKAYYE